MDGIPASDSTPKTDYFGEPRFFCIFSKENCCSHLSGVAIKMDKRTRKMVPIIVEKMPPCRSISSGDEKITQVQIGRSFKEDYCNNSYQYTTVKKVRKFKPIFTILSTNWD